MRKTYSRQQLFQSSLSYFQGDELATNVWIDKYALRPKEKSDVFYELTPHETINRIVDEILRIEKKYKNPLNREEIFRVLDRFKFIIFGGSGMYGIGNNESLSSLGNCFVVGNQVDSYGSICMIDEEQVQLMKRRGGVGHDLSHLRFFKAPVNGSAKTSTGAVSFAPRYSNSTREVAQDGRRGALMLSFHIKHPDSDKFINLKSDRISCTGANVSLRVNDEFMDAVKHGSNSFKQQFPIDSENPQFDKIVNPQNLWRDFIKNTHSFAEPGLLYWDTIARESLPSCYGDLWKEISTNPCGEIPLCPYDSCRLLAINLYSYVINPFTSKAFFDFEQFAIDVRIGMRLMDDLIDLEEEKIQLILEHIKDSYEDEEISRTEINLWNKVLEKLKLGRRTGFGIMGGADMLAALNLIYGTREATNCIEKVIKFMSLRTYETSIELAKERGSFPIWDYKKEIENPFLQRVLQGFKEEGLDYIINDYCKYGRRNIACLTVAPTGSTSIEALVNGGFEPVFMTHHNRNRKINAGDENVKIDFIDEVGDAWEQYVVIHKPFKDWFLLNRDWLNDEYNNALPQTLEECSKIILRKELNDQGEIVEFTLLDEIQTYSPYHKATANEIDVYEKIRMQGRIQKWIDHSISITHNLPENITLEEVSNIYIMAWEEGCKGCTIYRDKSRTGVLTKLNSTNEEEFNYLDAVKRPDNVNTDLYFIKALKEKWIVFVGKVNDKPYEIFNFPAKNISQDIFNQMFDCIEIEGDLQNIQKKNVRFEVQKFDKRKYGLNLICNNNLNQSQNLIPDIVEIMENDSDRSDTKRISLELRHGISPKYITQIIEKQYKSMSAFDNSIARVLKKYIDEGELYGKCEVCKEKMIYQNGCPTCSSCGFSKCS